VNFDGGRSASRWRPLSRSRGRPAGRGSLDHCNRGGVARRRERAPAHWFWEHRGTSRRTRVASAIASGSAPRRNRPAVRYYDHLAQELPAVKGAKGRSRWAGGGLRAAAEGLAVGMPLVSGSDPSSPPRSFRSPPGAASGLRRPPRQAPRSAATSCPDRRIGASPHPDRVVRGGSEAELPSTKATQSRELIPRLPDPWVCSLREPRVHPRRADHARRPADGDHRRPRDALRWDRRRRRPSGRPDPPSRSARPRNPAGPARTARSGA